MSYALTRFTAAARQIGLELSPDKCEVIPTAGNASHARASVFPSETKWLPDKSFVIEATL